MFGVRSVSGSHPPAQGEAGPSVFVSVPADQHLLLGAEEGIFILNRNDQEATLEMVRTAPGGPREGLELGISGVLGDPSASFSTALSKPDYLGVLHQQCPHVSLRSGCGSGGGRGVRS